MLHKIDVMTTVALKSLQTTLMIDPPTQDSESSMPHPSIIPSCIKVGTRQQGRATDRRAGPRVTPAARAVSQ